MERDGNAKSSSGITRRGFLAWVGAGAALLGWNASARSAAARSGTPKPTPTIGSSPTTTTPPTPTVTATASATSPAPPQPGAGHLLPSGYLRTSGSQIVDVNGNVVRLAGVNWYGFDCSSMVVGGLDHQTVDAICQKTVSLGFNCIRLPFCVQVVASNPVIVNYLGANTGLVGKTALEIMDVVINTAGAYGLKVVLDSHRAEAGWSEQSNGLWYTQAYSDQVWISSWKTLVQRYASNQTVIGADLHNEPGAPPQDGAAWPQNNGSEWGYNDPNPTYNTSTYPGDWAAAAQRAGNAILSVNPNLLIFVEGVRYDPAGPNLNGTSYLYWPGGNLVGVSSPGGPRPSGVNIQLSVNNQPVTDKLVYSAHDYGPEMYSGLAWCQVNPDGTGSGASSDACYSIWDQSWGYLVRNKIAPVMIGEFGTVNGYKPNDDTPQQDYTDINSDHVAQGYWFTYLVNYLSTKGISWCYWSLNGSQSLAPGRDPSQADWYGVLKPDWSDYASAPMMKKLQTIQ